MTLKKDLPPAAFVSNGNDTEFVATSTGDLYVRQYHPDNQDSVLVAVSLGSATQERIDETIFNLQQMRSVCPKQ